jgi:tetratricopeptide (TPR) repeat protein
MPSTSPPVAATTLSLAKPDPAVGSNQPSPKVLEPEARAAELVSLANAHEQAERLNEAEEALHEALAVAPGHAGALHLLGIVSFKQGWVEKAALLIEQSIGASRDTALYHRNICEVYRTLGRYDDALAAGRRAAALAPDRRARSST